VELLATGRRIDVVKINHKELRMLSGGESSHHDLRAMGYHMLSTYPGIGCLAITDGPDEAFLLQPPSSQGYNVVYRYHLHSTKPIISPIGAGDTCSAVMMALLVAGHPPPKAFLWGLAGKQYSLCDHHHHHHRYFLYMTNTYHLIIPNRYI